MLIEYTVNKQTNITNRTQIIKNPNWWEANQLVIYNVVEELNSVLSRTNPNSRRLEDLNQGPPDFKSSALNHSATPPHPRRGHLPVRSVKLHVRLMNSQSGVVALNDQGSVDQDKL